MGINLLKGHRVSERLRKILGGRSVARKRLSLGLCCTCVKVQALCKHRSKEGQPVLGSIVPGLHNSHPEVNNN